MIQQREEYMQLLDMRDRNALLPQRHLFFH